MPIQDYSTDPDSNVQISGINIAEGCPPSGINNAIRQLMADVKVESEAQAEAITAAATQASSALEAFAEGQAAKDEEQDEAISTAQNTADAAGQAAANAQASADAAQASADAANQGLVGVVRTVNDVSADAAGNVTISVPATPKAYVTATYVSGTQGYRKWSDGFIQQWGVSPSKNYYSGDKKVTLPQAFKNTNYVALAVPNGLSANNSIYGAATIESTATSYFRIESDVNGNMSFKWYACGF